MKHSILALGLLFAPAMFAQPGQAVNVGADCWIPFTFNSSTGTAPTAANGFDNRQSDCRSWVMQYQATGFAALTLTVQSSNGSLTPTSYGTYAGTVSTGANPNTNTVGAAATFANGTVSIGWMRVLFSATGSGNVTGVLMGYRQGAPGGGGGGGGSGCTAPCVVIGPDAPGAASTQNPVQMAGNDGTDVRAIKTDAAGDTLIAGGAPPGAAAKNPVTTGFRDDSGNAQAAFGFPDEAQITLTTGTDVVIVAGTVAKLTYLGHISFSANSAQTMTIQEGTGSTCGSSTVVLFGPYQTLASIALDFSSAGGLHTKVTGDDLCLHFGASVTAGGGVVYGVH